MAQEVVPQEVVKGPERPWQWTQTTGPFLPFLLVTPVPLVGHPNEVQPQALRRVPPELPVEAVVHPLGAEAAALPLVGQVVSEVVQAVVQPLAVEQADLPQEEEVRVRHQDVVPDEPAENE
jgi:hypothetical protein